MLTHMPGVARVCQARVINQMIMIYLWVIYSWKMLHGTGDGHSVSADVLSG